MGVVDPRDRYSDLRTTQTRETVDAGEFDAVVESEAATVGWVVLAFVFDDAGRVLFIDQPWADGWLVPGGVPKPGESLADAVVREVNEETGIEITPVRPHAVEEYEIVHDRTGEATGWTTVCFEATAETTTIADDLGCADEQIDDAAWFDGVPEDVFASEQTNAVYRRCRSEHTSP